MPFEPLAAIRWVVTRLSQDPEIAKAVSDRVVDTVHSQRVRSGGAYPLIVVTYLSMDETNVAGTGKRSLVRPLILAKVIDQGESLIRAGAIAAHIDRVLTQDDVAMRGIVSDGATNFHVRGGRRVQAIQYREIEGGTQYVHAGGQYRLHMHQET